MPIKTTDVLKHVNYIVWSSKAVASANRKWRARRPYIGETIMTKAGLHHWLLRWGIDSGLIEDPGPNRHQGDSAYVAVVFHAHPEAVKREARNYWRLLVDEHERIENAIHDNHRSRSGKPRSRTRG